MSRDRPFPTPPLAAMRRLGAAISRGRVAIRRLSCEIVLYYPAAMQMRRPLPFRLSDKGISDA